ncbi:MAG: drug resistance transporter, Bcr/CflA subfamily [Gemmatimonadetes bacterium]|nr:drug resistance transporter, Bcr/CflA subfamily [Gemmatimonadota bacterium]
MRVLKSHSLPFTLLLGALVTLASFATDMGLPVLASTASSLHVAPATAALTMSLFMAGFAFGPLVMGPISDRHGRRPLLLMGCATFSLFGVLGAFAASLPALLAWRFFMGVGAGTVQVLVIATVRDHFTGAEARVQQSYVSTTAGIAPIIAPTLGVWIATLGGWRAIYGALAGGGVVLFALVALYLRDATPRARSASLTARGTLANYLRVMRHPVSMGYAVVVALGFGCLFAYVSGSSLVLIGLMGVSQRAYGALFAATSIGLVGGALGNAWLNRRGVSHTKLIAIGLVVISAVALVLLGLAASALLTAPLLITLIVISHIGQSIMRANAMQGALEPMPEIAGVASAVLTGLQMIVGAASSAIAAALFDGHSAVAMTATMSICSVGALSVYFGVVRPAQNRKALPAVAGTGIVRETLANCGDDEHAAVGWARPPRILSRAVSGELSALAPAAHRGEPGPRRGAGGLVGDRAAREAAGAAHRSGR